jgi:hypothetical protein
VALKILELREVEFNPSILQDAIESWQLGNLKQLRVFGVRPRHSLSYWSNHAWFQYDYHRLKAAMLMHLPNLEVFTWVDKSYTVELLKRDLFVP